MSDLSKLKNEFVSFLEGLTARLNPEAATDVDAAAMPVHQAIADVESAAVKTAETVAPSAAPTVESMVSKDVSAEFNPIATLATQLDRTAVASRLSSTAPTT